MNCPEKEDLQQKCSTAWNAYEDAVNEFKAHVFSMVGKEPKNIPVPNMLMFLPEKVLINAERALTEVKKGNLINTALLRKKHLVASDALSKHISSNRC